VVEVALHDLLNGIGGRERRGDICRMLNALSGIHASREQGAELFEY
jgi:hypothetical protein